MLGWAELGWAELGWAELSWAATTTTTTTDDDDDDDDACKHCANCPFRSPLPRPRFAFCPPGTMMAGESGG